MSSFRRGRLWRSGITVGVLIVLLSLAASVPPQAEAFGPFDIVKAGLEKAFGFAAQGATNVIVGQMGAVLEYMFGGLSTTITLEMIQWITTIQVEFTDSLTGILAPAIVIGVFLLLLSTVVSAIQAMGTVVNGTNTGVAAASSVLVKHGGLGVLMAAWYSIVPLVLGIANGMSSYVLGDQTVKDALTVTFKLDSASDAAGSIAGAVVSPIIFCLLLIAVALTFVLVLTMKYVLSFAFAVLFIGGPILIGAGGLPGIGPSALGLLSRSLFVSAVLPLAWAVVFAAWAGVVGGLTDVPASVGTGLIRLLNGPGTILAAFVVLLGVTRVLMKLASPFSAPVSLSPLKLAITGLTGQRAFEIYKKGKGKDGGGSEESSSSSDSESGFVDSTATEMGSSSESSGMKEIAVAGAAVATGGAAAAAAGGGAMAAEAGAGAGAEAGAGAGAGAGAAEAGGGGDAASGAEPGDVSADAGDDAVTGEASEDASGTASGADDTGATADSSHEPAQPADDTATPDIASRARPDDDDDEGANRGRPDDTAATKAWESLSQEDRQALGGLADDQPSRPWRVRRRCRHGGRSGTL